MFIVSCCYWVYESMLFVNARPHAHKRCKQYVYAYTVTRKRNNLTRMYASAYGITPVYIRTNTRARPHTHTHTHAHTHLHIPTHLHKHRNTCTHVQASAPPCERTHTHARTLARALARTHAHTYKHTHIHTHTKHTQKTTSTHMTMPPYLKSCSCSHPLALKDSIAMLIADPCIMPTMSSVDR